MEYIQVSTDDGSAWQRTLTEAERTYLEQIAAVDGPEAVYLSTEVHKRAGRVIGVHYTIPAEAWEYMREAVRLEDARALEAADEAADVAAQVRGLE